MVIWDSPASEADQPESEEEAKSWTFTAKGPGYQRHEVYRVHVLYI